MAGGNDMTNRVMQIFQGTNNLIFDRNCTPNIPHQESVMFISFFILLNINATLPLHHPIPTHPTQQRISLFYISYIPPFMQVPNLDPHPTISSIQSNEIRGVMSFLSWVGEHRNVPRIILFYNYNDQNGTPKKSTYFEKNTLIFRKLALLFNLSLILHKKS